MISYPSAVHWLFREMLVITVWMWDAVLRGANKGIIFDWTWQVVTIVTCMVPKQISSFFPICVGYTISVKFAISLSAWTMVWTVGALLFTSFTATAGFSETTWQPIYKKYCQGEEKRLDERGRANVFVRPLQRTQEYVDKAEASVRIGGKKCRWMNEFVNAMCRAVSKQAT